MAAGRAYAGPAIVAFATAVRRASGPSAALPGPRIGITVSRRLRGAVDRNRARRRVREAVRLHLASEDSPLLQRGMTLDVVLIARPRALTMDFDELSAEVGTAVRRALAKAASS